MTTFLQYVWDISPIVVLGLISLLINGIGLVRHLPNSPIRHECGIAGWKRIQIILTKLFCLVATIVVAGVLMLDQAGIAITEPWWRGIGIMAGSAFLATGAMPSVEFAFRDRMPRGFMRFMWYVLGLFFLIGSILSFALQ